MLDRSAVHTVNITTLEADWTEYWDLQGYKLVHDSWIEKFKDFIDPVYKEDQEVGNSCTTNDLSDALETSESNSSKQWAQIWEDHLAEQYLYYYQWFTEWWKQNHSKPEICVVEDSNFKGEVLLDESTLPASVLDIESLSIQNKTEMDDSSNSSEVTKQHQEKSLLEKTEDFLVGLGFSNSLQSSDSNIDSCKMLISKKKKKKKKKKKHVIIINIIIRFLKLYFILANCYKNKS